MSHGIILDDVKMVKAQKSANKNLEKVIALCNEMLELADLGDYSRLDDRCGIVFGTMRDSAYKIQKLAKNELTRHGSSKIPRPKTPPRQLNGGNQTEL